MHKKPAQLSLFFFLTFISRQADFYLCGQPRRGLDVAADLVEPAERRKREKVIQRRRKGGVGSFACVLGKERESNKKTGGSVGRTRGNMYRGGGFYAGSSIASRDPFPLSLSLGVTNGKKRWEKCHVGERQNFWTCQESEVAPSKNVFTIVHVCA